MQETWEPGQFGPFGRDENLCAVESSAKREEVTV